MSGQWLHCDIDARSVRSRLQAIYQIPRKAGAEMRITKSEYDQLGGMKNPRLYRLFKASRCYYYASEGAHTWNDKGALR